MKHTTDSMWIILKDKRFAAYEYSFDVYTDYELAINEKEILQKKSDEEFEEVEKDGRLGYRLIYEVYPLTNFLAMLIEDETQNSYNEGKNHGYDSGYDEGFSNGRERGYNEGIDEGRSESDFQLP